MDSMKHRRLQELDRSDFEIVKGEPDIRGWDVKSNDRRKIGEVEELILDAREKKVRYMVVDLDDNELKVHHRKVLIPIGLAELDQREDDVLIPRISPQQFLQLPEYNRNELTPEVERRVCSTLGRQMEPGTNVDTPRSNVESATARDASVKRDTPVNKETTDKRFEPKESKAVEKTTSDKAKNENDNVDPDFYRHEYYNVDNLYKNRLHEVKPAKNKNESEYERGLRLWERRSEGGLIADESSGQRSAQPMRKEGESYREMDEETRMEMIRNRRNNYRQRRYPQTDGSQEPGVDETT
jgi:PRC-barrel domain